MAKTLEQYTSEISKSYDASRAALQNQINAIDGSLAKQKQDIEARYGLQQNNLNNQRDFAASNASMQAAGAGGSFGGRANIANNKYYEQTFVPAQAQLNYNKSHSLDEADAQANTSRLTLNQQLANMQDSIQRSALERYYDALEKDRQYALEQQRLALQRSQIAAANNAQKYLNASRQKAQQKNSQLAQGTSFADYLKSNAALNYGGWADGMDQSEKEDYLDNMLNRWQSGDSNTLRQIMGGSTYQHYLDLLGGR